MCAKEKNGEEVKESETTKGDGRAKRRMDEVRGMYAKGKKEEEEERKKMLWDGDR